MPERLACRRCGTGPVLPRTTTGTPAVARGTRDRRSDAPGTSGGTVGGFRLAMLDRIHCEASTGSESAYRLNAGD